MSAFTAWERLGLGSRLTSHGGNRLETIENKIPIPPPTFLLLTVDGRLILMGEIHKSGWRKSKIEGTLLSGILSAIMTLIGEVADESSSLRTIDAGAFQIMLEQSENVVSVLLVDRNIPEFRNYLLTILDHIDKDYGSYLKYWSGYSEPKMVEHIKQQIMETIKVR
ncbi:MAG: hypothetical protein IH840_04090 [Candidatus Heimdallarchaeota archaeon]|nr:hypothetical protein [Candidatus Heimdallarchaeota archaeon]